MASTQYKVHRKNWSRIFSLSALIYAFLYIVIGLSTKNLLCGFLLGLFGAAVAMGIAGAREVKQRNLLWVQFKKEARECRETNSSDESNGQ